MVADLFWFITYEVVGDIANDAPLHSNPKNIHLHIEHSQNHTNEYNYHIADNEHNKCISFTTGSISTTMST